MKKGVALLAALSPAPPPERPFHRLGARQSQPQARLHPKDLHQDHHRDPHQDLLLLLLLRVHQAALHLSRSYIL